MAHVVKRPEKHICEDCGAEFVASPTARFCPACRKKRMQANVKVMRHCTLCGKEFAGTPRSLYCPSCRIVKRHINYRNYVERKRAGKAVELGKTVMNCEVCGKPFVVKGGGQRYCPDCAKAAYMESDRQQSRAWAQRAKEKKDASET